MAMMGPVISASEYQAARSNTNDSIQTSIQESPAVAIVKVEAKAVHETPGAWGSAVSMRRYNLCQNVSTSSYINSSLSFSEDHKKTYKYGITSFPSLVKDENEADVSGQAGKKLPSWSTTKSGLAAVYTVLDNADAIPKAISGGKNVIDGVNNLLEPTNSFGEEKDVLDYTKDSFNILKNSAKVLEGSVYSPVRTFGKVSQKVLSVPTALVTTGIIVREESKKEKYKFSDFQSFVDPIGGSIEYYDGKLEPPLTEKEEKIALSQRENGFEVINNLAEFCPSLKIVDHVRGIGQVIQAKVDMEYEMKSQSK